MVQALMAGVSVGLAIDLSRGRSLSVEVAIGGRFLFLVAAIAPFQDPQAPPLSIVAAGFAPAPSRM